MNNEEKTITITEDKEVLIKHRNAFQKTLLDNILDLRRHEFIKSIKPDYQRKNQQGKYVDVDELIADYKKGAANALSYVKIIDELLEMDKAGKLSEAWADISEGKKPEEEKPAENADGGTEEKKDGEDGPVQVDEGQDNAKEEDKK